MITLVAASLIGCASSGKVVAVEPEIIQETDATASASISGDWWELTLSGIREETVTLKQFAEIKKGAAKKGVLQDLEVERKGVSATYQAYPLKELIARIDGTDWKEPFVFDDELWEKGYDVTLTASDGYSATFSTADVASDALYFYDVKDGETSEPGIVGLNVSSKYFINDLVSIQCALAPKAEVKDIHRLEVVINGQENSFSRPDLKKTPYYVEGIGGFTTSAGTYYENTYGGIALAEFLNSFVTIAPENGVTMIATDGFTMSYNFEELSNRDDGIWILAFEIDGEFVDIDPGPFRGVKIQDVTKETGVPNIDGHSSPKMVKRIEVSAEVFRDFSLLVKGKMESNLDRATIQSGINCSAHKTSIDFFNKKSGEIEHYTGMPLFSLLAFGDDPHYAPHKQTDQNILAYDQTAAKAGYKVKISAADGYSIVLDSKELDGNEDVILAMYQDGEELSDADWPLKLVWDVDTAVVPEGIKAVKNITSIELLF
jgi:hypothetical protein